MTKVLRVAALFAALMLVGATQAAAGNAMKASLEGSIVGVNVDPAAVAARCPAEFQFQGIVQTAGSGQLTSEAYTGPVDYSEEHCSPLLIVTEHDLAVIPIYAGLMTLVTPDGSVLHAAFKAPSVLKGDLTLVGPSLHRANGPYTITHGTGIFAGASGHGHLGTVADSTGATIELNGSLDLPG